MSRKALIVSVVTVVSLVADQASKLWIQANVAKSLERIDVIPGFFQLVHVENTGAAFGILGDFEYAMWVFAVFTVVAIGVLISLYREVPATARFMPKPDGAPGVARTFRGAHDDRAFFRGAHDDRAFFRH